MRLIDWIAFYAYRQYFSKCNGGDYKLNVVSFEILSFHGGQHEPTLHRNPVKRSKCDNTAKIHGLLLEISSKQFPKIQPNLMQNTFGLRFRFSVRR